MELTDISSFSKQSRGGMVSASQTVRMQRQPADKRWLLQQSAPVEEEWERTLGDIYTGLSMRSNCIYTAPNSQSSVTTTWDLFWSREQMSIKMKIALVVFFASATSAQLAQVTADADAIVGASALQPVAEERSGSVEDTLYLVAEKS